MVPASARSETNQALVKAKMMHTTAGLGDASRRMMLVANMPAGAAPADRAGARCDVGGLMCLPILHGTTPPPQILQMQCLLLLQ